MSRSVDMLARASTHEGAPPAIGTATVEDGFDPDRPWVSRQWWTSRKGPSIAGGMWVDAACPCGAWILWGPLATAAEKREPRCSAFPFAARGAA